MSADNQEGCPGRPDSGSRLHRREFLKLAAVIPTALSATHLVGAEAATAKAKPADATPMPQIMLGKYSISRLNEPSGRSAAAKRWASTHGKVPSAAPCWAFTTAIGRRAETCTCWG